LRATAWGMAPHAHHIGRYSVLGRLYLGVLLIGFGAYAFLTYKGGPGVAMGIACALTAVALWLIGWVLRHVVSGTWNN